MLTPYAPVDAYAHLISTLPDIVLLHTPPRGMCDDIYDGSNVGCAGARQYLNDAAKIGASPKLVVAGHIHEAGPLAQNPQGVDGVVVDNGVVVINPGNVGRFAVLDPRTFLPINEFAHGTFQQVVFDGVRLAQVRAYQLAGCNTHECYVRDI